MGRVAPVRDVGEFHIPARGALHPPHGELRQGVGAGAAEGKLALAAERHQRGQVAHRAVRAHHDADDVLVRAADRREALRPDAEIADQVRLHDDGRHGGEADRVAVRRAGRDGAHPDHAGAAIAVHHHDVLAENARHVVAQGAGVGVRRAARRVGQHDRHRAVREGGGGGRGEEGEQGSRQQAHGQAVSPGAEIPAPLLRQGRRIAAARSTR